MGQRRRRRTADAALPSGDMERKVRMNKGWVFALCGILVGLILASGVFLLAGPGLLDSKSSSIRALGRTALSCRIALRMAGPGLLLDALDAAVERSIQDERHQTYELVLDSYDKLSAPEKKEFIRGVEEAILKSGSLDYANSVDSLWPHFSLDFVREGVASTNDWVRTIARCVAEQRAEAGMLTKKNKVEMVSHVLATGLANGNDEIVADALFQALIWDLKEFLADHKEEITKASRSSSRRASEIAKRILAEWDYLVEAVSRRASFTDTRAVLRKAGSLPPAGTSVRAILLPLSKQILTLSPAGRPAAYSVTDGRLVNEFPVSSATAAMSVTADERFLAVGCIDGTVSVWRIASGNRVWVETVIKQPAKRPRMRGRARKRVWDVSFAGNGRSLVVAAGTDGAVVYETHTGRLIGRFVPGSEYDASSAVLSPDGTKGAITGSFVSLRMFDVASGTITDTRTVADGPISYCSHADCIAVALDDVVGDMLGILDMANKLTRVKLGRCDEIADIWPHSDGSFLLVADARRLFDSWMLLLQYAPQTGRVRTIAEFEREKMPNFWVTDFCPEQMLAVATTADQVVRVLDLRTGATLLEIDNSRLPSPPSPLNPLAGPPYAKPSSKSLWEQTWVVIVFAVGVAATLLVMLWAVRRRRRSNLREMGQ